MTGVEGRGKGGEKGRGGRGREGRRDNTTVTVRLAPLKSFDIHTCAIQIRLLLLLLLKRRGMRSGKKWSPSSFRIWLRL